MRRRRGLMRGESTVVPATPICAPIAAGDPGGVRPGAGGPCCTCDAGLAMGGLPDPAAGAANELAFAKPSMEGLALPE